ncbi:MAG TPA: GAF domain-containing protein [Polyangiaceae bacterium]|nr:GAF domain-containing protein [Polyangiaceae bacterium]
MQPKRGLVAQIKDTLQVNEDRDAKAGQICKAIRTHFGQKWVGVYDVHRVEYTVIAWSGPAVPSSFRLPLGKGLIGEAVTLRKTVVAGEVKRDPRYVPMLESTQSEIIIPVISAARDIVVGILDVQSDHIHAFTKAHRELLEECAAVLLPLWQ